MSAKASARLDQLIATARGVTSVPRSLLTYLRRQVRRVEKGETVPLAYPGLPLYIIVPIHDRPMIELVKRTQRAPSAGKRSTTISWTVEELAQCLAVLLPPEGTERKHARTKSPAARRPRSADARPMVRGGGARGRVQRKPAGTEVMKWLDAQLEDPKMAAGVRARMREMEKESQALERKRQAKK